MKFLAVKMLIWEQFTRNGKVDHAWSLFISPERMPVAEIFDAIESGKYFYIFSEIHKEVLKLLLKRLTRISLTRYLGL